MKSSKRSIEWGGGVYQNNSKQNKSKYQKLKINVMY